MSFTARELSLKLTPQSAPAPGFQLMPVCNLCDTTGGIPCAAPSYQKKAAPGAFSDNGLETATLAALRQQLQSVLSQHC
jgi:hypothetical protein